MFVLNSWHYFTKYQIGQLHLNLSKCCPALPEAWAPANAGAHAEPLYSNYYLYLLRPYDGFGRWAALSVSTKKKCFGERGIYLLKQEASETKLCPTLELRNGARRKLPYR